VLGGGALTRPGVVASISVSILIRSLASETTSSCAVMLMPHRVICRRPDCPDSAGSSVASQRRCLLS